MKIAVAHFRIGLTDGVSLQIEERARILKALGHDLVYIAGSKSTIADLRIPYFDFLKSHPQVKGIGIHHDFWWDPSRIEKFKVKSDPFDKTQGHPEQSRTDEKLKVYIDNFFPP